MASSSFTINVLALCHGHMQDGQNIRALGKSLHLKRHLLLSCRVLSEHPGWCIMASPLTGALNHTQKVLVRFVYGGPPFALYH